MVLADDLRVETHMPWERNSLGDYALLFFGRPIPHGSRTVASHRLRVSSPEPGIYAVSVSRYNPESRNEPVKELTVPPLLTWEQLVEFVELLVPRLGGVSPLYQTS